jgi:hypothetical protein
MTENQLCLREFMINYFILLCHGYKSYLILSRTKPLNVANKVNVVITPAE